MIAALIIGRQVIDCGHFVDVKKNILYSSLTNKTFQLLHKKIKKEILYEIYNKTMDIFLALPIYTLLGAFLLQRIIYVYLNGLISEMLFLLITIIPSIAIIIYISVYNKSLEEYGFHLHKPIIQLFCGIVLYVFMGIFFRFTFLSPPPFSEALRNIIAKFDRINIANFFYIFNMLLNVLTEEILWRGFVLTFLSKKSNNFFAIFITSVFFGLMHFPVTYSFTQVINTCIISILYCSLRTFFPDKFSILSLTVTHFLWNVALY